MTLYLLKLTLSYTKLSPVYEELGIFACANDAQQYMRNFVRADVLDGKVPQKARFGDSSVCKFVQGGRTVAFKIKAVPVFIKDTDFARKIAARVDEDIKTPQKDQVQLESEVLQAARKFIKLSISERKKLGMVKRVAEETCLLPLSTLANAKFRNLDFPQDEITLIKTVNSLIACGLFTKVEKKYALDEFKHMHGDLLVIHQ